MKKRPMPQPFTDWAYPPWRTGTVLGPVKRRLTKSTMRALEPREDGFVDTARRIMAQQKGELACGRT